MALARDVAIVGTLINLLVTGFLFGAIPVARDRTWIRERTIASAGFTAACFIVALVLNASRFGFPFDRDAFEWLVAGLVVALVIVPLNWVRTVAVEWWKGRR